MIYFNHLLLVSRKAGMRRTKALWGTWSSGRLINHRAAWPGMLPYGGDMWLGTAGPSENGQALLGLGPETPAPLQVPGQPLQLFHLPCGTILHRAQESTCCWHTRVHFPFQALMRWDNGYRKVCKCESMRSICSRSLQNLWARKSTKMLWKC